MSLAGVPSPKRSRGGSCRGSGSVARRVRSGWHVMRFLCPVRTPPCSKWSLEWAHVGGPGLGGRRAWAGEGSAGECASAREGGRRWKTGSLFPVSLRLLFPSSLFNATSHLLCPALGAPPAWTAASRPPVATDGTRPEAMLPGQRCPPCAEGLDYVVRGTDPFSLKLSNKERQQPAQQQPSGIKEAKFCFWGQIGKKNIFLAALRNLSRLRAMRRTRLKIAVLRAWRPGCLLGAVGTTGAKKGSSCFDRGLVFC